MKTQILPLILCFISRIAFAQNDPRDQAFVREVMNLKEKVVYVDAYDRDMNDLRKDLKNNVIVPKVLVLTKAEHLNINKAIADMQKTTWKEGLFNNSVMIRRDTLDVIFRNPKHGGWDEFYKKYGRGYYQFSKPIFLRSHTFCIFYKGHSCGELCGSGGTSVYQLINGKWKNIAGLTYWIS